MAVPTHSERQLAYLLALSPDKNPFTGAVITANQPGYLADSHHLHAASCDCRLKTLGDLSPTRKAGRLRPASCWGASRIAIWRLVNVANLARHAEDIVDQHSRPLRSVSPWKQVAAACDLSLPAVMLSTALAPQSERRLQQRMSSRRSQVGPFDPHADGLFTLFDAIDERATVLEEKWNVLVAQGTVNRRVTQALDLLGARATEPNVAALAVVSDDPARDGFDAPGVQAYVDTQVISARESPTRAAGTTAETAAAQVGLLFAAYLSTTTLRASEGGRLLLEGTADMWSRWSHPTVDADRIRDLPQPLLQHFLALSGGTAHTSRSLSDLLTAVTSAA